MIGCPDRICQIFTPRLRFINILKCQAGASSVSRPVFHPPHREAFASPSSALAHTTYNLPTTQPSPPRHHLRLPLLLPASLPATLSDASLHLHQPTTTTSQSHTPLPARLMTEYDYSPDANERYQAKMAGVGRWASEQRHHAAKYSNPFLPPGDQASSPTPRTRLPVRQETYPKTQDRPQPTRSRTLPASIVASGGPAHGQTSRAYAYAQQNDARAPHPLSSRNHHRSGSQPPDSRYPYPTAVAPGAHHISPRASPYAPAPPPAPGARQVVMDYKYVPGQPILLPQPKPGERYIIYPPPGARVDVIDPRKSSTHSRSQSRSSKASSPTKKGGDPLFKRLITNLTPNIEWGDSRSGRSSKRDGSTRRSASR